MCAYENHSQSHAHCGMYSQENDNNPKCHQELNLVLPQSGEADERWRLSSITQNL